MVGALSILTHDLLYLKERWGSDLVRALEEGSPFGKEHVVYLYAVEEVEKVELYSGIKGLHYYLQDLATLGKGVVRKVLDQIRKVKGVNVKSEVLPSGKRVTVVFTKAIAEYYYEGQISDLKFHRNFYWKFLKLGFLYFPLPIPDDVRENYEKILGIVRKAYFEEGTKVTKEKVKEEPFLLKV